MKKIVVLAALVFIVLFFCIVGHSYQVVRAEETTIEATTSADLTTTIDFGEEVTEAYEQIKTVVLATLSGLLGSGALGLAINLITTKKKKQMQDLIDNLAAQNKITTQEALKYKNALDAAQDLIVKTTQFYEGKIKEILDNQLLVLSSTNSMIEKLESRDERINALLDEELAKNDA